MNSQAALQSNDAGDETSVVTGLIHRARAAMAEFEGADQARGDESRAELRTALESAPSLARLPLLALQRRTTRLGTQRATGRVAAWPRGSGAAWAGALSAGKAPRTAAGPRGSGASGNTRPETRLAAEALAL